MEEAVELFVVGTEPKGDPFASKYIHVAVWDDDLRACAASRYIEGVRDDDDYLEFPSGSIRLTHKGIGAATVNALLGSELRTIEPDLLELLHEGRYETAVREACVRVEVALKRASGQE